MDNLKFNNVYISNYFTIVGPKEKESKLKNYNLAFDNYYFGEKTFELAEIKIQKTILDNLINNKTELILGADLINQISISSYSSKNRKIPFIGVYSACASFVEELLIASTLIDSKKFKNILCLTSSHSLTAERQYRYPVEYGNFKPHTATCTLTGGVGAVLTKDKTNLKIISGTFGKIIDLGINDVNNMGAIMAPACADTLHNHLVNKNLELNDYDLILTGDLGKVGLEILKDYYEKTYGEKLNKIIDSSSEIYYDDQNMYAGGSGPCCLPILFFTRIINQKKYKKILLLGTGSLHSSVLVNEKQTIPAICHAVDIEVIE